MRYGLLCIHVSNANLGSLVYSEDLILHLCLLTERVSFLQVKCLSESPLKAFMIFEDNLFEDFIGPPAIIFENKLVGIWVSSTKLVLERTCDVSQMSEHDFYMKFVLANLCREGEPTASAVLMASQFQAWSKFKTSRWPENEKMKLQGVKLPKSPCFRCNQVSPSFVFKMFSMWFSKVKRIL